MITPIEPDLVNSPHLDLYNLAFGDVKEEDNSWIFDDSSRSNNGDMPKVMATVVRIAIDFMKKNKNAVLTFSGYIDQKSDTLGRNQRTILYQRAIESNWVELNTYFQFWGIRDDKQEDYVPGKLYNKILVQHR